MASTGTSVLPVSNPRETLGICDGDSPEKIKTKIRKMLMAHHPDRNGGSRQAERRFKYLMRAVESVSKEKDDPYNLKTWFELMEVNQKLVYEMVMAPFQITAAFLTMGMGIGAGPNPVATGRMLTVREAARAGMR